MKVLHFVSYSADTDYLANLGKGLIGRNIELTMGTLFDTGNATPTWIAETGKADYFCLRAKSKWDFPLAVLRLAKIIREKKFEVVQTHLYEASFVGLLAAKIARVPVKILTRHHLDQAHLIGRAIPIAIDRWEAKTADKVVTLANAVKEFMVAFDRVDREKIVVVSQGFDFEKFSPPDAARMKVRSEFGLADDDFVIATIGNFFPTKGHRFLVSAVSLLLEEIPTIKGVFIGDGGDKESVKRQIEEQGLTNRFIFAGFRKDVSACIKAADVVVHPSLSEAFCQVLIETMAVGRPIISTDVGSAKEMIRTGETGWLVPPEKVDAIVSAVRDVYSNCERATTIAGAGQRFVRERYTVEKMVDQQVECYEACLNGKE